LSKEKESSSKLIIVSHRLPVTVTSGNNKISFTQSSGGLATGLSSYSKKNNFTWIGFSGITTDKIGGEENLFISERLLNDYNCVPVSLTEDEIKQYYNGFSNNTIWPLFHYFPIYTSYSEKTWLAYKEVNQKFCDEILKHASNDDTIWIHDYQLMLLPQMIRERLPDARIGFFLHIPFPSSEVYRLLPYRKELLSGLLGADLIGFHTYNYYRHFLSSVLRICGNENRFGEIDLKTRMVKADVFPMGIDYNKYSGVNKAGVKKEIEKIREKSEHLKIILSIDRLDYSKGILQRLEAFDYFLEKNSGYHEKIIMILVAVPTRTEIKLYRHLKSDVDRLIASINGRYSTISWTPIRYMYRSIPFNTLLAFYNQADVALLTPLRDGMNLIAKEYAAAQTVKSGVIILSEMAGVAEEMGEAIIVNPNDKSGIAEAIKRALEMPEEERDARMAKIKERVREYDVFRWADDFISKLQSVPADNTKYEKIILTRKIRNQILDDYKKSESRVLFLDYDGTLVNFSSKPEDALPDEELYSIIDSIAAKDGNDIVVISGRSRDFLEKIFSSSKNLSLVAEHGAWIRHSGGEWHQTIEVDTGWKKLIRPLLEKYVRHTPGTFIEEKDFSLAWHYRDADVEFSSVNSKELKLQLLDFISNLNIGLMEGNRVIEVKSLENSKGLTASRLLAEKSYDFILAAGDDITDETMFEKLPENAYTLKIGLGHTSAKYNLYDVEEFRQLLKNFGEV
jgi:trehalose 6-phosphate synthase/phosphatase